MIFQEDIDNFSPELKKLLQKELDVGNIITQTWRGWPKPGCICIALKKSFSKKNSGLESHIIYSKINGGPHDWNEQYLDDKTNHLLVSQF